MGDAEEVVEFYLNQLPVYWLYCPLKGQIPQRNYALKKLSSSYKIVIYFDDDIQLETNAIEEMIDFWNNQEKIPAGVSFNIINLPPQQDNIFRHLFYIATKPHGKVWRSGFNSPLGIQEKNINSDWLPGGVTAWRKDILDTYSIPDISSKWAICEDLIFSYPVGKNESLLLCHKAKVKHIDNIKNNLGFYKCMERGRNTVFWRLYFVSSNSDLSILLFYWMNIGLILGYGARSLKGNIDQLGYMIGTLLGVFLSLNLILLRKNILESLK